MGSFMAFLSSLGGIGWVLVFFVIALSVIVFVHEYGHYIVGRWSGIHAEVFSIGFGPVLISRPDKRGTVWQIAAIPLGGFVKFKGDSDASSGKDAEAYEGMSAEEQRSTMHGAPLWARAATVAAGPVFNFIMSIIIFAGIAIYTGVATEPLTVKSLNPVLNQTQAIKVGDQIIAINGTEFSDNEEFSLFARDLPSAPSATYDILRDGREMTVEGPHPMPALVGGFGQKSAAQEAGIELGDLILEIDGVALGNYQDLLTMSRKASDAETTFKVWRPAEDGAGGEELSFTFTPRKQDNPLPEGGFETRYFFGITGNLFFEPESITPGFGRAVSEGWDRFVFIIDRTLQTLKALVQGLIDLCNLGGAITIAKTSGEAAAAGPLQFIFFIGMLSTAVGFLNLFPIPTLDGGHLVFHAYESVTGRPPSDKAFQLLMGTGLVIVLGFMVFALGNDVRCLWGQSG